MVTPKSQGKPRRTPSQKRSRESVDLILDAGPLQGGIGSTIVDVTDERLQILREGEISTEEIHSVIE